MELLSVNQPLARRLLGQYMMFGLMSVVVLAIGLILVGHLVSHQGEEHELLGRIDEVRSLILADQAQNRGVSTQTLVNLLGTEDWVAYVALIARNGTIVAHSKPSRIGQRGGSPHGRNGNETAIEKHVVMTSGHRLVEYWAPLCMGDDDFGSLQVGVAHQDETSSVQRLSKWMPLAIIGPMSVLFIGSTFLKMTARTNSLIEDQLRTVSMSPSLSSIRLKPLADAGMAAAGWNRIVEQTGECRDVSTWEEGLHRSVNRRHETHVERILNVVPDGVALTDAQGDIVYANPAFSVLTQHSATDTKILGKAICEVLPGEVGPQLAGLHGSRPESFELRLGAELADGVLRIGRYPVSGDEDSTTWQHVWTVRDITQQTLTAEMRNQFVYAATHELRTPLANIKAHAETLTTHSFPDVEQQKHFLNIINTEATRLARFIDELLNISQMEAGSLTLARKDVDLERLFTEVADKVRPQMEAKRIAFDTTLPPKLPKLQIDKDRFTAALINLLGNAAKYTSDDGRVILKVVADSNDIRISVEDTGIGIDPDELPKLFTKFFRSADTRVRDLPGNGLGLAFTQEIVRLHGGKLLVHSEFNKGSQFTIVLPIV